jgi:RNA polymerase sigma-70 factor (ECF subfamily)
VTEIPKTRVSLILRLGHAADAEAWQEFVEIYQPLVFRLALKKGLQPADARDLTQEVLLRVAKAVKQWNPNPEQGTFRGWISRITRNMVIDFFRNRQRLPVTSDETSIFKLVHSTPQPSADTGLFDFEQERQIFAWAAEKIRPAFNTTTWDAFWATAVEQKTPEHVADALGISRGAVYVAKSRVMARLKQTVAQTRFDGRLQ